VQRYHPSLPPHPSFANLLLLLLLVVGSRIAHAPQQPPYFSLPHTFPAATLAKPAGIGTPNFFPKPTKVAATFT
jgi:hypothetical protein